MKRFLQSHNSNFPAQLGAELNFPESQARSSFHFITSPAGDLNSRPHLPFGWFLPNGQPRDAGRQTSECPVKPSWGHRQNGTLPEERKSLSRPQGDAMEDKLGTGEPERDMGTARRHPSVPVCLSSTPDPGAYGP